MNTIVPFLVLFGTVSTLGAQTALRIDFVDGNLSIEADRVDLGTLLRELDAAAGTDSTVPPEIAGQRVSARLSGLSVDQAIRKLFGGLSLDYAVVGRQRIVVLARSQAVTPSRLLRSAPADPDHIPASSCGRAGSRAGCARGCAADRPRSRPGRAAPRPRSPRARAVRDGQGGIQRLVSADGRRSADGDAITPFLAKSRASILGSILCSILCSIQCAPRGLALLSAEAIPDADINGVAIDFVP